MKAVINGISYDNVKIKSFECVNQNDLNRLDDWVRDHVDTLLDTTAAGAGNEKISSMYIVVTYIPKVKR